jgi:hypothetical protein
VYTAINGILFIAEHKKRMEESTKVLSRSLIKLRSPSCISSSFELDSGSVDATRPSIRHRVDTALHSAQYQLMSKPWGLISYSAATPFATAFTS